MTSRAFRLVTYVSIVFMSLVGSACAARPLARGSVVEGTLTYRERMALPPDAVAKVSLLDTSRMDAAAPVIARANVLPEGRQVPLPFTLRYDPNRIEPTHTYAVRAVIRSGGRTLFTTDTAYPVITQGHPSRVALNLVFVGNEAPRNALRGTRWLLEDLGGRGVLDRVRATLEFTQGDRVGGHASCNRFFGTAKVSGGSISFGPLGATRMSCPEAVMVQEARYLRALEGAEQFELGRSVLLIHYQDSPQPLRFTRLGTLRQNSAGAPSPGLDQMAFRAAGTESFWSLDISPKALHFTTPDNVGGVRFATRVIKVTGESLRWVAKAGPSKINVHLWPGSCSDGMSDRTRPYQAVVRTGGTTHRGCGVAITEGMK